MSRYEFAAIVYRIVQSGMASTDPELSRLVRDFSPELKYIRIDTIQKDRNGNPTIERVRVNKGSIINVGVRKYSFLTPFLHKKVDIDGIHSYN